MNETVCIFCIKCVKLIVVYTLGNVAVFDTSARMSADLTRKSNSFYWHGILDIHAMRKATICLQGECDLKVLLLLLRM